MAVRRFLARIGMLPALALLTSVCACTSYKVANTTPLEVVLSELPAETPAYRLQPGDQLEIRFFQQPEQNVLMPVRPDGFISLPLASEVRAAGRTPDELRRELEASYASELRDPRIAVIVQSASTYKVHVGGHVPNPGVFELEGGRDALQAIFEAGGFLDTASPEDVFVMRRTGEHQFAVIPIDLEKALDGRDLRQNLELQPFDIVYVPRSPIANVNSWVDLYLRRNLPFSLSAGWRFDNQ